MFVSQLNQTFDFRADEKRTKIQEKLWCFKMSDNDTDFYKLQCQNPPTGYCLKFVDKKWKKSKDRQESRQNRSNYEYYEFYHDNEAFGAPDEGDINTITDDPAFEPNESCDETAKKTKYEYVVDSRVDGNENKINFTPPLNFEAPYI